MILFQFKFVDLICLLLTGGITTKRNRIAMELQQLLHHILRRSKSNEIEKNKIIVIDADY